MFRWFAAHTRAPLVSTVLLKGFEFLPGAMNYTRNIVERYCLTHRRIHTSHTINFVNISILLSILTAICYDSVGNKEVLMH